MSSKCTFVLLFHDFNFLIFLGRRVANISSHDPRFDRYLSVLLFFLFHSCHLSLSPPFISIIFFIFSFILIVGKEFEQQAETFSRLERAYPARNMKALRSNLAFLATNYDVIDSQLFSEDRVRFLLSVLSNGPISRLFPLFLVSWRQLSQLTPKYRDFLFRSSPPPPLTPSLL